VDVERQREIEHCLRQEQAVGGDDERLRTRGRNGRRGGRVLQGFGLVQREAAPPRKLLDRTRNQALSASGGAVRLGQNESHLVPRGQQRLQRAGRELGGAGENEAQEGLGAYRSAFTRFCAAASLCARGCAAA
jgi:hypothetical protein